MLSESFLLEIDGHKDIDLCQTITKAKEWFIKNKGFGGVSTMLNSKMKWQIFLYNNDGEQVFWDIAISESEILLSAYNWVKSGEK